MRATHVTATLVGANQEDDVQHYSPVSKPGQAARDILLTAITAVTKSGICTPAFCLTITPQAGHLCGVL